MLILFLVFKHAQLWRWGGMCWEIHSFSLSWLSIIYFRNHWNTPLPRFQRAFISIMLLHIRISIHLLLCSRMNFYCRTEDVTRFGILIFINNKSHLNWKFPFVSLDNLSLKILKQAIFPIFHSTCFLFVFRALKKFRSIYFCTCCLWNY